jgi:hypothetical protein
MSHGLQVKLHSLSSILDRGELVGFEVLTAVVMKSTIFWNLTPCSPLSVNRLFGETYRLHLQGRKDMFSKKLAWKQAASGVISQKIVLFRGEIDPPGAHTRGRADWRKKHKKKLDNLFSSSDIIRAINTRVRRAENVERVYVHEKCIQHLVGKSEGKRPLGSLGV